MTKVTEEIEKQIRSLKEQGKSYELIGCLLKLSTLTARRHGNLEYKERRREESKKRRRKRMGNPEYRNWRNKRKRDYNRKNILHTTINGESKNIKVKKRPRPEECELCNRSQPRLSWHHWDDSNLGLGLWLCIPCHTGVEFLESSRAAKYSELKIKYSELVLD